MPDYANSLKSSYFSGDQASISRGPEPAGIALGTLDGQGHSYCVAGGNGWFYDFRFTQFG